MHVRCRMAQLNTERRYARMRQQQEHSPLQVRSHLPESDCAGSVSKPATAGPLCCRSAAGGIASAWTRRSVCGRSGRESGSGEVSEVPAPSSTNIRPEDNSKLCIIAGRHPMFRTLHLIDVQQLSSAADHMNGRNVGQDRRNVVLLLDVSETAKLAGKRAAQHTQREESAQLTQLSWCRACQHRLVNNIYQHLFS